MHVHTTYSDGAAAPEDVLNYYALNSEVRVLAITDHDTLDGALRAKEYAEQHPDLYSELDIIVGEEVSSRDGHILGLYLNEWIPPGMSAVETVEAIHRQNGVAIAAHPYTSWMQFMGLVGVGDLIKEVPFDAVEVRNSNFTEVFANKKADANRSGKAQIGASDGHFLDAVGLCYTEFPGETAADLRNAIEHRTTIAGGACYGVPTLMRYVMDRLRKGDKLLPRREALRALPHGGDLEIVVDSNSSFLGSVLRLEGRLIAGSAGLLDETLRLLLDSGVGAVLDLTSLELIDSEGITVLVRALKSSASSRVGFAIAAPRQQVLNSLKISRLDKALNIFSAVAPAKAYVDKTCALRLEALDTEPGILPVGSLGS